MGFGMPSTSKTTGGLLIPFGGHVITRIRGMEKVALFVTSASF